MYATICYNDNEYDNDNDINKSTPVDYDNKGAAMPLAGAGEKVFSFDQEHCALRIGHYALKRIQARLHPDGDVSGLSLQRQD